MVDEENFLVVFNLSAVIYLDFTMLRSYHFTKRSNYLDKFKNIIVTVTVISCGSRRHEELEDYNERIYRNRIKNVFVYGS